MSGPHPARGKGRRHSVAVVDPIGQVFDSYVAAATTYNCTSSTVKNWCRGGRPGWRFARPGEGGEDVPAKTPP